MGKLYDISRPVTTATLLHPGDPQFMHTRYAAIGNGRDYNLSLLTLGAHTGTHFDFPRHFDDGAAAVQDFPPERFIVQAHVVDCGQADAVEEAHLQGVPVQPGEAVLLKTRNGSAPQDKMTDKWVYIKAEAAAACVKLGCGIVGMDYIEVEQGKDKGSYPVHHTLLGNGVLLLENIDLRAVSPGQYRLYCLPLLIPGLEASPCRAVLETLD